MYGAIDAGFLIDYAKSIGMYHQLPLEGLHTPEWYFIKPEYVVSVTKELRYFTSNGSIRGQHSTVDHPSFTELREHLGKNGLIQIERSWSNGDRVLKSFYLNNYLMLPGDKFACGAAMHYTLERHGNYNNGQIDSTVKNYREEYAK